MLNMLLFLYQLLFNNFTLTILVFTVLIRLVTYPLTYQQQKSTRKLTELQQSDAWKNSVPTWSPVTNGSRASDYS